MDRCPTCQAGLSAPGDVSKQSTEVCTARKLVIQPGITRITAATAPVRKETAGQWAARGGGGTPTILNSSDSSAGPKEARAAALRLQGRASRAEGQTAGKPATRVSALGRKAGAGPGKGDQARPEPGVHPRLPGHSGEAPAPSLLLPSSLRAPWPPVLSSLAPVPAAFPTPCPLPGLGGLSEAPWPARLLPYGVWGRQTSLCDLTTQPL